MKIVHCPTEIAGQMGTLCNELRKKGMMQQGLTGFTAILTMIIPMLLILIYLSLKMLYQTLSQMQMFSIFIMGIHF